MGRKTVSSGTRWEKAYSYSRAVRVGNQVEVAGTTAVNEIGELVGGQDPYLQARFIFEKIEQALRQCGADLSDVVRTRMFVSDIAHADEVARAHGEVFLNIRPASTLLAVSALVEPQLLVEIEVSAVISEVEDK